MLQLEFINLLFIRMSHWIRNRGRCRCYTIWKYFFYNISKLILQHPRSYVLLLSAKKSVEQIAAFMFTSGLYCRSAENEFRVRFEIHEISLLIVLLLLLSSLLLYTINFLKYIFRSTNYKTVDDIMFHHYYLTLPLRTSSPGSYHPWFTCHTSWLNQITVQTTPDLPDFGKAAVKSSEGDSEALIGLPPWGHESFGGRFWTTAFFPFSLNLESWKAREYNGVDLHSQHSD